MLFPPRLSRAWSVCRYHKGLRRLFTAMYLAVPVIGNALLLFVLVVFIFSVLGVNLFYGKGGGVCVGWGFGGGHARRLHLLGTGDQPLLLVCVGWGDDLNPIPNPNLEKGKVNLVHNERGGGEMGKLVCIQ